MGQAICHFVAYCNGTGQVTFLQSTIPSLTYGSFDYITPYNEINFAHKFLEILQKEMHADDDCEPEDYLSIQEAALHELFYRHCVYAACKGEGGDEWRYTRAFTITLTLHHAIYHKAVRVCVKLSYNC